MSNVTPISEGRRIRSARLGKAPEPPPTSGSHEENCGHCNAWIDTRKRVAWDRVNGQDALDRTAK